MKTHILKFNDTEQYVLRKRFSRQLITYWEKCGHVSHKAIFEVEMLTGRPLEELLGKKADG
jgi:hypothetical protein